MASPALVVSGVELKGLSGYELCHALKARFGASFPVVFVSARRTSSLDVVAGLMLGADDYVVAPFDPSELLARVHRLLPKKDVLGLHVLTPRELDVMQLLVDGRPIPAIAGELVISKATARTHVQRILGKLGANSRAEATSIAMRAGMKPRDLMHAV